MQLLRRIVLGLTATFSLVAQIPDFTPPTPLLRAILRGDADDVRQLLQKGADPNEGRFIGAPPLVIALMQHNADIAQALLASGADANAADGSGATALMWAATDENADTTLIKGLLDRGVDPNTANKGGETALSWALRRGYTPAVEMLKKAGASDRKFVRDSIERAAALLQKSGPEFVKVSGCSSCHHQSLPQMAFAVAKTRGFQLDPQIADKQAKMVVAMFKPYREQMLQGKDNIPDPAISVSYSLIGLGAEGVKPNETTEAMAYLVSRQQDPDGSFRSFAARPPMESSRVSATALSVRALRLYGTDPDALIVKARAWLRTAPAVTTEEKAMKVLGLIWSNADAKDIRAASRALIADQRPDGGWSQLRTLESDAYATGQALTALFDAGQIDASDDIYNRGAAFLLRTQRPDGSWLVRTRSVPIQQYKESGFPHGKDQWISAAGTSWAVMALASGLPATESQVSELK